MGKPILYLLIGYPGAGKTTVSRIICEATGAVHLWADAERHKLSEHPTHSYEESRELYERLNQRTAELLEAGNSVVFDTNFNFYSDRQKLRGIADETGADTIVVWVNVSVETARHRSVDVPYNRNGYQTQMSEQRFAAIVDKVEPPRKNEKTIKIDGTELDRRQVLALLKEHVPNISLS